MKKLILILFFAFSTQFSFGQQDSLLLEKQLESLSQKVELLEIGIKNNKSELENQNLNLLLKSKSLELDSLTSKIDLLNNAIINNTKQIQKQELNISSSERKIRQNLKISDEKQALRNDSLLFAISGNSNKIKNSTLKLDSKIELTENNAQSNISNLKQSLSQKTTLWVGGICFVLVLTIIMFLMLKKSIHSNDTKLMDKIAGARKSLEEEALKLDGKLVELLEKQLTIQKVEKPKTSQNGSIKEADHSLALKVADEIIRIQKNLSRMEDSIKGKKQLSASVSRIQSNFEANGYEIMDMIGKTYDSRMNVIVASSVPDEGLKEGEQVISRIIKPQVNFKDKMIQSAEIEVSVG